MILLSAITISIEPILRIHSGCKITNNSRIIALILIFVHIGIKKDPPWYTDQQEAWWTLSI